ncbi:MAG: metal ABC transporter permease [Thermodesulfovibrionales bacterium]|nr:metal ABC transporter permease [Thermodesulfovibrionales bacterium]
MELLDFLTYGFIQRAIIAGCFIALACSILGVQLVLRKLSLIGDGLSHVTFGGVALGMVFGFYPIYFAIPVVVLCSVGILKLSEKAKIYADAAIGIVSSLGIATGVILASKSGGFNVDLFSYLFGNILAISNLDVVISIFVSLIVLIVIFFFYSEIFSVTFDEEFAKASGINANTINLILVIMTAITVVLAMKIVGIMLTSALLILPAVSSFQVARSFKGSFLIASFIGVLAVVTGVFVSFLLNLPSGACIIVVNFLFLCSLFFYKSLK